MGKSNKQLTKNEVNDDVAASSFRRAMKGIPFACILIIIGSIYHSMTLEPVFDIPNNDQKLEKTYKYISNIYGAEIDKVYGGGLYKEDVKEIENEYTGLYQMHLYEKFSLVENPIALQIDVEFYTLTLKKARDGEIEFNDIIENPGEHIRSLNLQTNGFYAPSKMMRIKSNNYYKEVKKLWKEYDESGVKSTEIIWSIYHENILDEVTIDEVKSSEQQLVFLDSFKRCLYRNVITKEGLDSHKKFLDNTQEDLDYMENLLEKKYGEDFIGVINLEDKGPSICMPANDSSLHFEIYNVIDTNTVSDKYVTLLSQRNLYGFVESVINEVGLNSQVISVVKPIDSRNYFDIKEPSSLEVFELLNSTDFYTHVTLHYMLLPNEEIEYDKIIDFYKLVQEPFKTEFSDNSHSDVNSFEYKRVSFIIYFYDIASEDIKKMVLNASNEKLFTERYENYKDIYYKLFLDRNYTRDQSDGCLAIVSNGFIQDRMAEIDGFIYEEFSSEKFIERIMKD